MKQIGVLGLGLLGRGIAACMLAHGANVRVYSHNSAEYGPAESAIATALDDLHSRSLLGDELHANWRERIHWAQAVYALSDCDFLIESITESLEAKRTVYAQLETLIASSTPIATNTSSLPIADLQAGCVHPQRLIGMHWAEPAYATRFLEIVRGPLTDDATLERSLKLAQILHKEACVVTHALPGFIANRLGYALYREALHLLQMGVADAETIDRAFRNSVGLWAAAIGPLRWIDLTGGPELYLRAMDNVLPTLSNARQTSELVFPMVDRQGHGILDGNGFYSYSAEEALEWQRRFHAHVWTIHSVHENEFPIKDCSLQTAGSARTSRHATSEPQHSADCTE